MEQLPFTILLNKLFGGTALALLHVLHIPPGNSQAPIPNFVAMQILVVTILLLLFALVRSRLSVETPGGLQHIAEGLHELVTGQSQEVIGEHSEGFTPFLIALTVFISCLQSERHYPRLCIAHRDARSRPGVRPVCLCLLPGRRIQTRRTWLSEELSGPGLVAVLADVAHRTRQPVRSRHVAHHSSVCQHVCRRHGHGSFLFSDSDRRAGSFSWAAHRRLTAADLHLCSADDGLSARSRLRGTLMAVPWSARRGRTLSLAQPW